MNKKFYKKIFIGLTFSTALIPIVMSASCDNNKSNLDDPVVDPIKTKKQQTFKKLFQLRNKIQNVDTTFIQEDILRIKFPDEKLTHLKPTNKNYTSEALWCLDAYNTPQNFNFEGSHFKIEVFNVTATPGTDQTDFTLRIQSIEFPSVSTNAQITVNYFKETPLNHNHFFKIPGQKITLKECMEKYNYTKI